MRKRVLAVIALLWLLFVVVLYYAGHKPGQPDQLFALWMAVYRVLLAGILTALAGGLGALLVRGETLHPLTRLALQAGAGFGLLALGVLIIGSTLGLPAWLPWAALGFLVVLLHRPAWRWLKGWQGLIDLWRESTTFGRVLGMLLGLIFLAALGVALAPPVQYDSLMYHLVLPNAYLQAGRVSYLPWIVMSGMPQTTEMLYTWAIALGGNPAAVTLGWTFGLLAVLGLMGSLCKALDSHAAWVGGAALLAGFTTAWLLVGGYVEWMVFLMALGALVMLSAWREDGSRRSLLLAGMFTGMAVGSKYTAAMLGMAALGLLAWEAWKRRTAFLPVVITFGAAAALAVLPWFLKNLLTTGNPFYPFFFSSGAMSELRLQVYKLPPWGNWLDFFLLPVRATYLGFDKSGGYDFDFGALLLGLGALAWLAWWPRGESKHEHGLLTSAVLIASGGLVVSAVGNRFSGYLIQGRNLLSIFPAFGVLAAAGEWGLRRLQLGPVRLGRLAAVFILLAVGFNTYAVTLAAWRYGAPQAALGLKTQQAYLADALGWFQPAMQAVRDLPGNARVQLIYEPRSLYCAPRCLPDEILDRWKRMRLAQGDDPAAIRAAWLKEGITHLLVNRQGVQFLLDAGDPHHPPEDLHALDRFLSTLPPPTNFGNVYELYSLQ